MSESKTDAAGDRYLQERRRALRFFNGSSFLYPVVERRLEPEYRDALDELGLAAGATVLDLATGTGGLAGAFAARGHPVTGLDFAERLLARARRRFPEVEFRHFDLLHLDRLEAKSRDVVSMAYFLHGLSPEFRRFVLAEAARIAREHVLVFDYCCDGGLLVRLIEWVTMGIASQGWYGIPKDVMFGFPVTTENGEYKVIENLPIDAFSQECINKTLAELQGEQDGVKHLL